MFFRIFNMHVICASFYLCFPHILRPVYSLCPKQWFVLLCLSPVLISRWWLCDRGSDRPGQGHIVSCPEGHISARPQETIYTGRALSPLVIHRRSRRAFFYIPNGIMLHRAIIKALSNSQWGLVILCLPVFFQAASREVERDFNSVYSRLVLCKTYR